MMPISSGEENSSKRVSRALARSGPSRPLRRKSRSWASHERKPSNEPSKEDINLFKLSHRSEGTLEDRSTLKLDSSAIRNFQKSLIDIKNLKQLFIELKNVSEPSLRNLEDLEKLLSTPYSKDQPTKENLLKILDQVFHKNKGVKNSIALMKTLGFNPFKSSLHIKNKISLSENKIFSIDDLFKLFSEANDELIDRLETLSKAYRLEENDGSKRTQVRSKDRDKVKIATMNPLQDFGPLETIKSKLKDTQLYGQLNISESEINRMLALTVILFFKVKSPENFLSKANKFEHTDDSVKFISSALDKFSKILEKSEKRS